MQTDPSDLPETGRVVYILEYSFGAVKVGYTGQPRRRIQAHLRTARQLGVEITQLWVSPPHVGARSNEQRLIRFCSERSEGATEARTGEHFAGLTMEEVHLFAQTLSFNSPDGAGGESDCLACDVLNGGQPNALALVHEIAHGRLRVTDRDGNDVSADWAPPTADGSQERIARELLAAWVEVRDLRDALITWAVQEAELARTDVQKITSVSRSTINRLLPPL